MTTKQDTILNVIEDNQLNNEKNESIAKQEIYPKMDNRLKVLALWLGLGFVVAVVLIQQFSGYN